MSLIFYSSQEEATEESIEKYKDIFAPYNIKPPILKEALEQMFISSGLSNNKVNELTSTVLNEIKDFITPKFTQIKKKYPKITIDDAIIISSYTYELPEKDYNIYKLLNTNMVAKNRKQGIKNISKYLFLLLNALRKLTRSYYKQLYRCISVLVKLDYDSFEKKYIPYLKGNEKTFWGFTSTSPEVKACLNFLNKKSKTGTIFSLIGDLWGYDITLFNIYGENEILLEPERKFIIEESIPEINRIIYVRCLIKKTPIIFENSYIKEQLLNCPNNIFEYINDKT